MEIFKIFPKQVTVIGCSGADGWLMPPQIILKLKNPPTSKSVDMAAFPEAEFDHSPSGWQTKDTMIRFLRRFHQLVTERGVTFPIVLFMDGYRAHTSSEVNLWCHSNDIILFNLHPHATLVYQPWDHNLFGPLKSAWNQEVWKFAEENEFNVEITQKMVPRLLQPAWEKIAKAENVRKSFTKCGLFPWNPDAVAYHRLPSCNRIPEDVVIDSQDSNDGLPATMTKDRSMVLEPGNNKPHQPFEISIRSDHRGRLVMYQRSFDGQQFHDDIRIGMRKEGYDVANAVVSFDKKF